MTAARHANPLHSTLSPAGSPAVFPRESRWTAAWLAPLALLALWQLASQFGWLPAMLAATPASVASAAWSLAQSGDAWPPLRISLLRAGVALLLGGGAGVALGLANGLSRQAGSALDAGLGLVRTLAALAFIPLILLGAGVAEGAKLALLSAGVFFPIYRGAFHGVRAVDAKLIELGRSVGVAGWPLLRDVILPGALPSLLAGLRVGVALLWALLMVLETLTGQAGIGHLAVHARDIAPADRVVLSILLYALLAKTADALIGALSRRVLRWNAAPRSAGAY